MKMYSILELITIKVALLLSIEGLMAHSVGYNHGVKDLKGGQKAG